ncbi:MAG: MerR family transcriptional regulator [Cyclonatronaceae bacterium]
MRIAELVNQSGVPRTTIHYYQRLGLLPKAEKRSSNSAIYGQKHLDRLKLITRLRSESGGSFSMDRIRAIITQLDSGSEKALAQILSGQEPSDTNTLDAGELIAGSELSRDVINRLIREKVIRARADKLYDEKDTAALGAISALLDLGIDPDSIIPIARVVEKLAAFEMDQYTKKRSSLTPLQRREFLLTLQQATDALHQYLFNRIRQHLLEEE